MAFTNNVMIVRHGLLAKLVKLWKENRLLEEIDRLPIELSPRKSKVIGRCCVHKERAVWKYKTLPLLGFDMQDEVDELTPLSEYAKQALLRSENKKENLMCVVDEACSSCVQVNYEITNLCRGCVARSCYMNCPKDAIRFKKNGQAEIDHDTCISCGKCHQNCPYHAIVYIPIPCEEVCPVKAISKDEYGVEHIDESKCIYCGKCVNACPFGAIFEISQVFDILQRLRNKEPMVAIVAPSILAQFAAPVEKVYGAIKSLGFLEVVEVAQGAMETTRHEAEELKEKIDLAKENYRFVRVVERGSGEQARLRLFDDMEYHPSETEISAALKKMLVTPVKVGVITGHHERSTTKKGDQDYSLFATHGRFRYSMINQGFDLVELNLKDMNDIPNNINILLIAEMRSSMSPKEEEIINRFLERGGNMMIMGDVGRQEVMNPLLWKIGLKLLPGIIAQPSDVNPGDLVLAKATQIAADSIGGFYKRMVERKTYSAVTMPSAVALEVVDTTQFHPIVLLQSNAQQTWIEYQTKDFVNDSLSLDSLQGEKLGAYPTAIALTRKIKNKDKEQRIIVLGDADCFSNAELQKSSRPGIYSFNFNMIPGSFRWLCYNEFPVSSSRDPFLDKDISLTPMDLSTIKTIYCYGIPFIIGLCGIWTCWRRRKR